MSDVVQAQSPVAAAFSGNTNPSASFATAPQKGSLILIALVVNQNGTGNPDVTGPSGFTLIAQDSVSLAIKTMWFYKIAGNSEGTTYSCTLDRSVASAIMIANYTGLASSWLDVSAHTSGSSSTVQSGSVATHADVEELWLSVLGAQYPDTFSSPSNGFTAIFNNSKATGPDGITYGLFKRDNTAPTTGPATMSATIGSAHNYAGIIIAIKGHAPITYTKTTRFAIDSTVTSSDRAGLKIKNSSFIINQTKLSAVRQATFNRTVLAKIDNTRLSGERKGHPVRTSSFKIDAVNLSASKVFFLGGVIIRDPSDFVHGFASGKISTLGLVANEGAYTTFVPEATDQHTVSLYLKSTDSVRIRIASNVGTTIETSPTIPATYTWTRVSFSTTSLLLAGTTYRVYIETISAKATQFWIDAVQAEEGIVVSPFYPGFRTSGHGPVGQVLQEQKPAGLVMQYIVAPGDPGIYATYQELYDHHESYEHVLDTEQTYKQVYLTP